MFQAPKYPVCCKLYGWPEIHSSSSTPAQRGQTTRRQGEAHVKGRHGVRRWSRIRNDEVNRDTYIQALPFCRRLVHSFEAISFKHGCIISTDRSKRPCTLVFSLPHGTYSTAINEQRSTKGCVRTRNIKIEYPPFFFCKEAQSKNAHNGIWQQTPKTTSSIQRAPLQLTSRIVLKGYGCLSSGLYHETRDGFLFYK